MTPMLARPAKESLVADDLWVAEPKVDGRRLMLVRDATTIRGIGRDGQSAQVPEAAEKDLRGFGAPLVLDGELIDGTVVAFDVLVAGETDLRGAPLETRREWLVRIMGRWAPPGIRLMPQAVGTAEKKAMVRRVRRNRGEGVMYKRVGSPYQSGRSLDWRKDKFVKDLDVVIMARGEVKENFTVGLWNGDRLEPVGEVASFTGDGPRLKVGDVCTITVLYVSESGRLVNPVKPRFRDDKSAQECTFDQLDGLVPSKNYLLRWAA